MKKLLLLLSFITCYSIGKAQTSNWLWAVTSSGTSYEYCFGLFADTAGNLFTSGRIGYSGSFGGISYTPNNLPPYSGKFDNSGAAIWLNTSAFTGFDYSEGFGIDNNDNTYVTGIEGASLPIAKFNKAGVIRWANTYSGTSLCGEGISADNSGNVYVTGTMNGGSFTISPVTFTYPGSQQGIFLAKLDSNGNCIWGKTIYGIGANDGIDQTRDLVVDNQGYIYFIGDYYGQPTFGSYTPPSQSGNSYQNFFVAKYDTAGNEIWVATSTNSYGSDFGGSQGIALDSCDNIYVTGIFQNTAVFNGSSFSLTSVGGEDGFVAKLNNNGQWQWVSQIGSSGRDAGFAICADNHDEVYVGGDYGATMNLGNGVTLSGSGGFVAKFANSTGQILWALGGVGSTSGHVYGMTVDRSGYAYAAGDYSGSATFGTHTINGSGAPSNAWIAKLDTVTPRVIIPYVDSSYCPGSTDTISYSLVGTFNSGNVFTVELSDSTGSFVNEDTIGAVTSTDSGNIVINIPSNTPTGSNYLIRIVSSNPATSSYVNGCGAYFQQNVYPDDFYVGIGGSASVSVDSSSYTICSGGSVLLSASAGNGATYVWINGTDTIAKTDTVTVYPTETTTYYVNVITQGGCSGRDSVIVTSNPAPSFVIIPQDTSFCSGQRAVLHVSGGGSNFIWSPSSGLIDSTTSGDSVTVSPTATTTYNVIGAYPSGCASSGTDIVGVIPSPGTPTFTQDGDTLISSSVHDNQWYRNDSLLKNDTSQNLIITIPGEYYVEVTNEVNGCSTSSDSANVKLAGINQLSVIGSQISIYPNPFNNDVFIKINSSAQDVKDWNLQVTDELGQTVFSRLSLDYSNDIDLSNLPSGIYFITVINKTGRAIFPVVKGS